MGTIIFWGLHWDPPIQGNYHVPKPFQVCQGLLLVCVPFSRMTRQCLQQAAKLNSPGPLVVLRVRVEGLEVP